jgi:hypothetical protein
MVYVTEIDLVLMDTLVRTLGLTAVGLGAFGAHGLAKHVGNDPKKLKVKQLNRVPKREREAAQNAKETYIHY